MAEGQNKEEVKTASDVRLEKIEAMLQQLVEKNEALDKENQELKKANAELYTFAKGSTNDEPKKTEVSAGKTVADEDEEKRAEARRKSMDEIFHQTLRRMGYEQYPEKQKDGQ